MRPFRIELFSPSGAPDEVIVATRDDLNDYWPFFISDQFIPNSSALAAIALGAISKVDWCSGYHLQSLSDYIKDSKAKA